MIARVEQLERFPESGRVVPEFEAPWLRVPLMRALMLGSLSQKPAVHGRTITPRTILHVTVLIDHDVVDGMPAARFVADAVWRLEGAVGA